MSRPGQQFEAALSLVLPARGEGFVIAKAGKPMVRVTALDTPPSAKRRRIGFLNGRIEVPADFDEMGREAIAARFERRVPLGNA